MIRTGTRFTRMRMRGQRLDPRRLDIIGEIAQTAIEAVHSWPRGYVPTDDEQPLADTVAEWDAMRGAAFAAPPVRPLTSSFVQEIVRYVAKYPDVTSREVRRDLGRSAATRIATLAVQGHLTRKVGADGLYRYRVPSAQQASDPGGSGG